MLVDIKSRIVKPPFGSVQVDWGHPLAQRLSFVTLINENSGKPYNLVTAESGVLVGTAPTWVSSSRGLALKWLSGSNAYRFSKVGRTTLQANPHSIFGVMRLLSAGSGFPAMFKEGPTASGDMPLYFLIDVVSGRLYNWQKGYGPLPFAPATDGLFHSYGYAHLANGAITGDLFVADGQKLTATADTGVWAADIDALWRLCTETPHAPDGLVSLVYVWNRTLTLADYKWLQVEPYAFLRPVPSPRYWSIPPAVAVTGGTHVLYLRRAA